MKVRIGIDVGGTFTDAVAIDNDTYELIGTIKVPTTHTAKEGVAKGIVEALMKLMEEHNINPEDVLFIAHGTTQATNALLEGDVVPVGIIAAGKGLEGIKVKSDTNIQDIELAPGKILKIASQYIELDEEFEKKVEMKIEEFKNQEIGAIVAAQAFSVDDPTIENKIVEIAEQKGLPATATHEITKLYGLKIRTRTAAINACILPKMIETANMTEDSVKKSGIKAPLMIMRGDGGVMNIAEVRKRPILTLLSGPAAGVAGALMYEKVSDGIFLEVGGTSTDISAIKAGKVMVNYAEIGGHKTYLNSLDVRTVGIAGGSMIRLGDKDIEDVGPRSAHIAGLPYAVYSDPEEIIEPEIVYIKPKKNDPDNYVAIKSKNGKIFAVTVSCAANVLGYVKPEDYAYGNQEAARKALEPIAKKLNKTVEEVAERIMNIASMKVAKVVEQLLNDYKLDKDTTILVGGGGGSASIVPYVAKIMGMHHRIAKNAQVISTIGVALAMVREIVERTIQNPTEKDILSIRNEAKEAVIKSGALEETVEIYVEIDSQKNIVRAIATGATELRSKDILNKNLGEEEIKKIAAQAMKLESIKNLQIIDKTGSMYIIKGIEYRKRFFGLLSQKQERVVVINKEGVIRLHKNNGKVYRTTIKTFENDLNKALEQNIFYGDGGAEIPDCFIILPNRIVDLSGLIDKEQIISLAKVEISGLSDNDRILILLSKR
ncbi:N-methylhydantoinase A/oxoprolinase/acetone carboxylase beta subunit [Caldanaerobacter subterraneus subsp. tengcongensis MB4]|uniref:N-methylhydaintoinase A n=1 Tax=Caldanaerobacter subterraneus subsp. tengcongensis (strain DSM 15242 / JCM 11007 / NBRC 100824 / MB4) TaxID=273068 RepID=Q8R733_CALS4|nr:N-methylhydaintoinase A [Caldanaerobacter subterraneus subsp. tengcongensis MB4]MCS3917404.1 N-methylhydantoinase A/oxoprolinase/acetone carboxylase beta subunit [Caldanaerobacter subterraneus subsp. tengcongensis MB4]